MPAHRPNRLGATLRIAGRTTRRHAGLVSALLLLGVATVTAVTGTASATAGGARYYLALGDSLSTGFQPTLRGEGIETHSGYVDDILARERRAASGLQLVDVGCPGDTTTSLRSGIGNDPLALRLHCDRSGGSQLQAALTFLRTHRRAGEVPLITLDIGINNLNRCAALADPGPCLRAGEDAITTDLPRILRALRAAAPAGATLAAMTLYDTYLGKVAADGATPTAARAFLAAYRQANATIIADDARLGVRTAEVAGAFHTGDTGSVAWRGRATPANLARTCTLTWACSPPPIGHNIHPDARGYRVIARAFELAVGRLVPSASSRQGGTPPRSPEGSSRAG